MSGFNKDFKLMIIGQIISLFGASILKFCISLYILDVTGSAEIFATIIAVSNLPVIFLSPIGGVMADRINRRNLMVIFDFTSSFIVAVFAFLLLRGNVSIFYIGVVVTLLSIISIMYQPTVQASIPSLVEDEYLLKANGAASGVQAITSLLGPILGGLFYTILGLEKIVIISGISFFLSAVMEIFIQIPFEKRQDSGNAVTIIIKDMKEGLQYIFQENIFVVKTMFVACGLNLFVTPIFVVGLPYIIKVIMSMPDEYYGFTQGALSISMIAGALAIGALKGKIKVSNIYIWLIFTALLFLPMSLSVSSAIGDNMSRYLIFSISAVLIMFCITIINIFALTTVQIETPGSLIGKVMAILIGVSSCAAPLGQIVFGKLFDSYSQNISMVIIGVTITTLIMAFIIKILFKERKTWKTEEFNEITGLK